MSRSTCVGLLVTIAVGVSQPISAQDTTRVARVSVGVGPQWRAIGAVDEPRVGALGEFVVRAPQRQWSPRAALGIARYRTGNPLTGRVCNPDGPCVYAAPALTILSAAVGGEWVALPHRGRVLAAFAGYGLLSNPVPSGRRGVRASAGAQVGIIVPLTRRVPWTEVEVRYERLVSPLESTRYFVPVAIRVSW